MIQKQHYIGLTDTEVQESRRRFGVNILTPPAKESLWKKFFEKLVGPFGKFIDGWEDGDPLIFILEIAALLSGIISCSEYWGWFGLERHSASVFFEPIGIIVAILLATGIAFYFELKADKAFAILNQVNDEESVKVIRNGNFVEIPKKDVVVGDMIVLGTGDEVPADAELLEAYTLHIDESTLTGELVCAKTVNEMEFDKDATFPSNFVMKGTKVMEGHGICKVFAVGDNTENGKVFEAAQIDDSVKTPLNEQLDGLGDLITKVSYGFAALIIIARIIMYFITIEGAFIWVDFTAYLLQTLMIAVTLVVVAVPEGLPMAVTLSLAYSMRRMLKTNNLVRKMHACETMGATTVICTDKTGTLTQNQMRIYQTNFYSLEGQKLVNDEISTLIKEGIAVNSTASLDLSNLEKTKVLGNPTEGALLLWLKDNGIDYQELKEQVEYIEELPFSTERKYMATIVKSTLGKRVLYIKGAPEIIYSLCKSTCGNIDNATIEKQLISYQDQAMRTLGFAYQILDDNEKVIVENHVIAVNLIFLGIAAIADPVREDVLPAVRECLDAGIDVKIVTGDTSGTAKEIGRQIGLWTDKDEEKNIITGPEFAIMSDKQLQERVMDLKIISRARPMDKKRLVEALQSKNQVVAVTGDGTNDAPALNVAHVGLSMGDGTSVAKEASDITIIDNSFSSIGRAVMWGRSLYQNIQRFILFQMTVNVAACFIVLAGAFMGTESPLTVTQMLWVNLIMDTFAAMALAALPPSEAVMREKPRDRNAFIIDIPMRWGIVGVGGIFFLLLLGLLYIFQHADITSLTNFADLSLNSEHNNLSAYELSLFFTIFVMLQFWNMFNARAFKTGRSAFHFKGCKGFALIALFILIGQFLIVSLGGEMFNVVPLKYSDWIIIIMSTSIVLWIGEILRLIKRK